VTALTCSSSGGMAIVTVESTAGEVSASQIFTVTLRVD
jgi:hypothetical protein